ncbi:MAG: DUF87 domain-containing protein [Gammaproteobacteria bacterium]|nr:DUF87 domain-containing protein [Gammaproteobacteria bacterium]
MTEFRHKAIYGMTGMGKTYLMKRITRKLRKHKQKVIVYSGVGDLRWPAGCKVTFSINQFNKWLGQRENFGAHVMIDEARVLYSEIKPKEHKNIHHLFTMGRHKGFTCYIATQYPTSIPPAVRVNCPELYCFRLGSAEHAKLVRNDYGDINYKGLRVDKQILNLKKLEFFNIVQPFEVKKLKL